MRFHLLSLVLATSLCACGGGDDSTPPIDAPPGGNIDASGDIPDAGGGGTPDAPGAQPVMGLGQLCMTNANCTTGGTNLCAELDMTMNGGFCTLSCGTGPAVTDPTMAMPPMGGDAICQGAYTGTSGTPACVLYSNDMAMTMSTWYCGILCGTPPMGTMDFGMCPGGLTCQPNNLCDD